MYKTTEELVDSLIRHAHTAVSSGLVLGSGGNISVRIPDSDEYFITKSGTWLDELTPASFARMKIGQTGPFDSRPSSEWKLHDRIYRTRSDVNSVFHLHPQTAVLLNALGYEIRFFTLDDALYVKSVGVVPYYPNGSDELADETAREMEKHNCAILAHHGCCTVGEDPEMAFRRASLLEQAAQNTYRAMLLGDKETAFPEGVELIHA
ncbi:class II aldolase/adducin family protein [Actinotignum schaalii]|uniref:Class II aldolase/adducin N-terminal domain-containing protein n=1 Tax=Actinotignum schaalii FB123-CNA-2 TaxID=883067 RepID=S2VT55_9ACTO|nr:MULTISPECIES: class II aldolase/adducin family protein [Actinotignum]EPD29295.1 hypothetical protein HMPREF9237_00020 [Actinotignum schaalii FB123-CNA-2]MDE1654461.1 class II aldolase/adducin family protein [Actinotignum schaalii]MDK7197951.1 class II aldolase/adducin family protein [Actinotignum sanguinis]MDK7272432.1 class II aldolase/adducin family protein [Actinotignum schaalii]MDK8286747.1 class II aldolase/adducin family protein [Actinotignum sanguinis]